MVNAAGWVRVDEAQADPAGCFAANAAGAVRLARACRERGVPIAAFSSDLVFDGRAGRPYVESDAPRPLNVYGASKARAERAIADLGGRALIVRTAAFFSWSALVEEQTLQRVSAAFAAPSVVAFSQLGGVGDSTSDASASDGDAEDATGVSSCVAMAYDERGPSRARVVGVYLVSPTTGVEGWCDSVDVGTPHVVAGAQWERGATLVLVTHAEVIRSLVLHCLHAPARDYARFAVDPASITCFTSDAGGLHVGTVNEVVAP